MKISRIDLIGQNGNTGEHYSEVPMDTKKFDKRVDKVCNWLESIGLYGLAKKLSRWHLEQMEK